MASNINRVTQAAEELYQQGKALLEKRDRTLLKDIFECFLKAAELGHIEAQCEVADFYHNGTYVTQDYAKEFEWYNKAAAQESSFAQYQLGCCYSNGRGVDKDNKKAAAWWSKAAAKGNQMARIALDDLKSKGINIDVLDVLKAGLNVVDFVSKIK
jgi:TPR repeat protein